MTTREEFEKLCLDDDSFPLEAEMAALRRLWSLLDADGTGSIDLRALNGVLKRNAEAQQLADRFDALGDFLLGWAEDEDDEDEEEDQNEWFSVIMNGIRVSNRR